MTPVHATALSVNGTGILILGPSGSGKSALALDLIDRARLLHVPAQLIGDDRVHVDVRDGVAFARPAGGLAGLVEVRGSGIHAISHLPEGRIDLAVRLVPGEAMLRMAGQSPSEVLPGVALPLLELPQRDPQALRAILARLGLYAGVSALPASR